jgi:hypothetical protein
MQGVGPYGQPLFNAWIADQIQNCRSGLQVCADDCTDEIWLIPGNPYQVARPEGFEPPTLGFVVLVYSDFKYFPPSSLIIPEAIKSLTNNKLNGKMFHRKCGLIAKIHPQTPAKRW